METDLPDPGLLASARQIMDIPKEDEMHEDEAPLHITGFALGHAAVLLYLALHAFMMLTPTERWLAGGTILLLAAFLVLLLRSKLRTAMAMAEAVAPLECATRPPR